MPFVSQDMGLFKLVIMYLKFQFKRSNVKKRRKPVLNLRDVRVGSMILSHSSEAVYLLRNIRAILQKHF